MPHDSIEKVIIVGAGQAGFSAAAKLRKEKFAGSITIFGDESEPPYQRPPLSKNYLLGKLAKERLYLRKENFYADNKIELIKGTTVTAIDRKTRTVISTTGQHSYDALILATGSEPRQLPATLGGNLQGVMTIRGIDDIDRLRPVIDSSGHLLIVGGGYIGLEAAAVARQSGLDVTLLEAAPRILGRVASEETANLFRDLHTAHGVRILENTGLGGLSVDTNNKNRVNVSIETNNEVTDSFDADAVVVGIGASATTNLATDCGLSIDAGTGGITTDVFGRTSDEFIWCAGDCSAFPLAATMTRLESVQNAIDQAENVALNILGNNLPYKPTPWFWSDQYDVKLQIAGFNRGYDNVIVRPGSKNGACSHWYTGTDGSEQRLLAVDAINDAVAYMTGRRLLESVDRSTDDKAGKRLGARELENLSDPVFDLKTLLKA